MSSNNNYLVITDKSECYRWLYSFNESFANLVFVEPNDVSRIESLLDSLDIQTVLVHLPSQNVNAACISDESVSPGISAVLSHLEDYQDSKILNSCNSTSASLNKDLEIVADLLSHKPGITIIALVGVVNQNALLTIMRAGVRDVIKIGTLPHEASAIIVHHNNRPNLAKEKKGLEGQVIALLNVRAEEGASLLAIHLSIAMQKAGPTLLIDFGIPHSDIMLILGLTAKFNFIDVVNNRARLDSTLIETGFAKHSSGLMMLGLSEIESGEVSLSPQDMHLALHDLKQYFKYIVINHAGLSSMSLFKVSVGLASTNLFLVEQTIPSCKRTYDLLQILRLQKVQINNPQLILDRYASNDIPTAESISESFAVPLLAKLPRCEKLRLATLNTGETVFEHSAKSQYAKAIKEIINFLVSFEGDEVGIKEHNFFSKIHRILTANRR